MTWVGMPVDIVERLERHGLSRDDRLLYVEGFLYAGQYLTDGTITPRLARISDHPDPNAAAQRLVEAEVWEQVDDGAFIVVDYFTANLTRDEIARRKEDARLRQERSRRHKAGDHSICVRGRYCPDGQDSGVTRDVTRDNTRESRPTYLPDLPDLPGKVREGKESAGDDTGRGSPNGSPAPASPPEATAAPHIYTDTQRLGACQHCQLPERNAAHHQGVPTILRRLAEQVADLGRLIPERQMDSTDHWWQVEIRDERATWQFETALRPHNDDNFERIAWIGASVRAQLTDGQWHAWNAQLQADDGIGKQLAWEAEGDAQGTDLSLSPGNAGNYGAEIDVSPHLWRLREYVTQLLAFPDVEQS